LLSDPKDFPSLGEEFQTRVEIKLYDQNRSEEILLLYDRYDKSGEFLVRDANARFRERVKYKTNELFLIRGIYDIFDKDLIFLTFTFMD
jgi:hypothetical protein